MKKYDLIVIGAGSAGYSAAVAAGKLGKKVLVIEKDKIGGTCLNYGCVPTKVFYQFAKLINKLKKFNAKSILEFELNIHFESLIKYKNEVVVKLQKGIEYLFKKYNVEFINGEAQILNEKKLLVVSVNDKKFEASNIIIATGSCTSIPSEWKEVVSSPDEFINLSKFPQSIAIVGGGVIGCEFAFIFSNLGLDVYLIEKENQLLPFLDNDISKIITKKLEENNVKIFTNTAILEILDKKNKYKIIFTNNKNITIDKIILSTGRIPNTNFIKNIVKVDEKGFILTDQNFKTSIQGIYAIGDIINNGKMYAHLASFQGIELVNHIFNGKELDKKISPYGIYTVPQIAGIGITEKEAENKKLNYEIIKFSMIGTTVGKILDDKQGFVKIIKEKGSNKVLGFHIISNNATELINIPSILFNNYYTDKILEIFKGTIFVHPTETEILKEIFY